MSESGAPIQAQVNGYFIYVRNLESAIVMYSKLFGYPVKEEEMLFGHLYFLPNGVILDSDEMKGRPIPDWLPVSLKLGSDNIDSARNYVQDLGFEIIKDINRGPKVSWFLFKDPDGNTLMMCQDH
ncbi:hypothetical protein FE783_24690 [Paenibacillus mesophilus]|uniref:VOC family protein n=1 Tax=Paenibacillus mesophilus TaxID=2582849 RepID=UPI00110DEEEF|nr:VOC family protein [Paenibacillus mesophilus]TMV46840.1 hypothetical protein FE783_24690 [Paenibacillus mesophilus]